MDGTNISEFAKEKVIDYIKNLKESIIEYSEG